MLRGRLVLLSLTLLLAAGLAVARPVVGGAQAGADRFYSIVDQADVLTSLAGPFADTLEQQSQVLSAYRAGLNATDFYAHAVFTNPSDPAVGWDYGFQFRTGGGNDDLRLNLVSNGTLNFGVGPNPPSQTVEVPELDVSPGAQNSVDLIVEGNRALFGLNGVFISAAQLPEFPTGGDIFASTGFYSDLVVPEREIAFADFQVRSLPVVVGAFGEDVNAAPPARPVALRTGTCGDPGGAVQGLTDLLAPEGERIGAPGVATQSSFTRLPLTLDDLLDEPFLIAVAQSEDAPEVEIACGEIGGVPTPQGALIVAVQEENGSGRSGIAFLAPAGDGTNVSLFLAPERDASPVEVEAAPAPAGDAPSAEVPPSAASDAEGVAEGDAPTDAAADAAAPTTIAEAILATVGRATPTPTP